VRFFKGDLRDLAAKLIFEEFWQEVQATEFAEFVKDMRDYIRDGKLAHLTALKKFSHIDQLKIARNRYKIGDYPKFDKVAITTLFTFYWKKTIETINFAKKFCENTDNILVGGIASTILAKEFELATGIEPIINKNDGASLDEPGLIDKTNDLIIDNLSLDYSILDEINYKYPASNAYFGYMTRGCVNRCEFCAVPKLEPNYCNHISIKKQIEETKKNFGEKRNLLLLDNNVFASTKFDKIIDEIKEMGFGKDDRYYPANEYEIAIKNIEKNHNTPIYIEKIVGMYDEVRQKLTKNEQGDFYTECENLGLLYAKSATRENVLELDKIFSSMYEKHVFSQRYKRGLVRYVDFNQGVDARLVTEKKIKKLSEINISPLRIAFDF